MVSEIITCFAIALDHAYSACTTVTNERNGATYKCTTASDSDVSACATGFWNDESATADVCTGASADLSTLVDKALACTLGTIHDVLMCNEPSIDGVGDNNMLCNHFGPCLFSMHHCHQ